MATASDSPSPLARQLPALFRSGTAVGLTDRLLLQRFATRRGEGAEDAFAVLVERHGAMVWRVCRGLLGNRDDADDAFQATFLVLARKAGSVRVSDSLGPWLHGVARNVAARSLASSRRRERHERAAVQVRGDAGRDPLDDAGAVVREEIARLPERFQGLVVLCDLEGQSQDDAARHFQLPLGTVKSRLARGRERLRQRLTRRGLAPSAVLLAPLAGPPTVTAERLLSLVMRSGVGSGGVAPTVGAGSAATLVLAEGVLNAMWLTKIKTGFFMLAAAGVVSGGTLAAAYRQDPPTADAKPTAAGTTVPPSAEVLTPATRPAAEVATTPALAETSAPLDVPAARRSAIEPAVLEVQIRAKQAQVQKELVRYKDVQQTLANTRKLRDQNVVSQLEVERAENGVQVQMAELEIAKAELEEAHLRLKAVQTRPALFGRAPGLTGTSRLETAPDSDQRLAEIERKLDRILQLLEAGKDRGGLLRP